MDELKALFGSEALTYDAFLTKLTASGMRLADLSKGGYIDINKHNREVAEARAGAAKDSKEYTDLQAERDKYKADYEKMVAENDRKDKMAKVSEKVQGDFVEFVTDKVEKAVADDNKKTFESALDEVLKAAPQYKKQAAKPTVRLGSSLKQGNEGGGEPKKTIAQSFNDALLIAAGKAPANG